MLKTAAAFAIAPLAFAAAPALAQNAPQNGVLVIYGSDRCPTDSDGNEIVVCVRRSEAERFRIPQELRDPTIDPTNQSWAVRQQGALEAVGTGTGMNSCSPVGPGGVASCSTREYTRARGERRQQRNRDEGIPR